MQVPRQLAHDALRIGMRLRKDSVGGRRTRAFCDERSATVMMPLPTYVHPRHETESRIPSETRRALRWEGVTGTLPTQPPHTWRIPAWAARFLARHTAPQDAVAKAAPAAAPAAAPWNADAPSLPTRAPPPTRAPSPAAPFAAPAFRPRPDFTPLPRAVQALAPPGSMGPVMDLRHEAAAQPPPDAFDPPGDEPDARIARF